MSSKRRAAIESELNKSNQRGALKYFYVDVNKLERLGITQYRPVNGDNFIRIIPPKDPTQFYGKEVFIHTNIGVDGATFLCPLRMYGKPCPICEYRQKIKSEDPDSELLAELAPRARYLFFVYDVRSEEKIEEGLHWFDAPVVVKDNIVSLSKDRRTGEIIDVSDLEDGRDIEFVKVGSGLKTKYEGFKLVPTDPIPKEWAEGVPDFDEVLLVHDYDKLKLALTGSLEDDEEIVDTDEEVIEEGPEERNSVRSRFRSRERKEEPEEEVVEEEIEEEPEEKPSRKSSSVKERLAEIRRRKGVR